MMNKEYKPKKEYKDRDDKYDGKYGDKYGDKYNDKYDDMDDMDEGSGRKGRKYSKKKACRFTTGDEDIANLTYKNPRFLASFMTEHGKIVPRRVTGNCAFVQRKLTYEIKRARNLALLGHTSIGPNQN